MLYALIFILFFALDILFVTKFQVLGMIPIHYLTAGVGVSFFVNYKHYKKSLRYFLESHLIFILFMLYILTTTLYHFIIGLQVLLDSMSLDIPTFINQSCAGNIILIIMTCALMLPAITSIKKTVSKWIIFSTIFSLLCNLLDIFMYRFDNVIYRYSGVVGLLMIFGWLMIILTLLNEEYNVRRS